LSTGDQGSLRAHARSAVEAAAARAVGGDAGAQETSAPAAIESRPARVGDTVIVPPFGLQGVVKAIADGQTEIDVHGKRLRAPVRDLRVVSGVTSAKAERPASGVKVTVDLAPRPGLLSDLNVVGCTVDEALSKAERFLDETLVTDQRIVRVIHGHGTGRLQKAISGFLKSHPLVDRFHAAPLEQGGGGVTVVELKD
jgi:DNA mismatch repair protein MutS2